MIDNRDGDIGKMDFQSSAYKYTEPGRHRWSSYYETLSDLGKRLVLQQMQHCLDAAN